MPNLLLPLLRGLALSRPSAAGGGPQSHAANEHDNAEQPHKEGEWAHDKHRQAGEQKDAEAQDGEGDSSSTHDGMLRRAEAERQYPLLSQSLPIRGLWRRYAAVAVYRGWSDVLLTFPTRRIASRQVSLLNLQCAARGFRHRWVVVQL